MFKRIRRYLLFLFMFTVTTANIVDCNVFAEEETLEVTSIGASVKDSIGDIIKDSTDATEYTDDSIEETIEETIADTSLQTVSTYIFTYKKLPPVYITKKEAQSLGWLGGSLADIDCTKSIGGDYFGNYQGLLPSKDGRCYWECDIDTLGTDTRGTKRLVYSNDGLMFYTEDHYATFQMLNPEVYSIKNQIL